MTENDKEKLFLVGIALSMFAIPVTIVGYIVYLTIQMFK